MDWRSFTRFLNGNGRRAADARRGSLEHQVQILLKSLASLGFEAVSGSADDLASWGGQIVLQRGALLLRVVTDRTSLIFDIASTCDPEEWYLMSLAAEELEQAEPSDSREPTPEEAAEFLGGRGADLPTLVAPAQWPAFRARLQERTRAQTAFMIKLLRRS